MEVADLAIGDPIVGGNHNHPSHGAHGQGGYGDAHEHFDIGDDEQPEESSCCCCRLGADWVCGVGFPWSLVQDPSLPTLVRTPSYHWTVWLLVALLAGLAWIASALRDQLGTLWGEDVHRWLAAVAVFVSVMYVSNFLQLLAEQATRHSLSESRHGKRYFFTLACATSTSSLLSIVVAISVWNRILRLKAADTLVDEVLLCMFVICLSHVGRKYMLQVMVARLTQSSYLPRLYELRFQAQALKKLRKFSSSASAVSPLPLKAMPPVHRLREHRTVLHQTLKTEIMMEADERMEPHSMEDDEDMAVSSAVMATHDRRQHVNSHALSSPPSGDSLPDSAVASEEKLAEHGHGVGVRVDAPVNSTDDGDVGAAAPSKRQTEAAKAGVHKSRSWREVVRQDTVALKHSVAAIKHLFSRQHHRHGRPVSAELEKAIRVQREIFQELLAIIPNPEGSLHRRHLELVFTPGDASRVWKWLHITSTDSLQPEEVVQALLRFYKKARNLAKSLADFENLSGLVQDAVMFIFWFMMLLLVLVIFGHSIERILLSLGTFSLTLAFAFGATIQGIVDSVLFLTITQPFDVGDRVLVSYTGNQLNEPVLVVQIRLMATTFKDLHNRLVTVPNHKLAQASVINLTRSNNAIVEIRLQVSIDTSLEQLNALQNGMSEHVRCQSLCWEPKLEMYVYELHDVTSMTVGIWLYHRREHAARRRIWASRTRALHHARGLMKELGIEYAEATQPVVLSTANDTLAKLTAAAHQAMDPANPRGSVPSRAGASEVRQRESATAL